MQKGVNETVIAEILGHKNDNIATGRYGKIYNVQIIESAINVIDY